MNRIIATMFLVAGLLTSSAESAMLDARAYLWLLSPEGDASIGSGDLAGTEVDIEDDLGYGSDEEIFGLRGHIGDMHQFGVDYFTLDLDAANTVDRTIRFSDEVFRASDRVTSAIEADLVRGYYRLNVGSEQARGGFLIGAQYADLNVEASAASVGSAEESADAVSPIIGIHFHGKPVPQVLIEVSVLGADWDFGDIDVTFIDFEAALSVLLDPVYAGIAYRYIDIEGEYEDEPIEVDLTFSGPLFFAGFTF